MVPPSIHENMLLFLVRIVHILHLFAIHISSLLPSPHPLPRAQRLQIDQTEDNTPLLLPPQPQEPLKPDPQHEPPHQTLEKPDPLTPSHRNTIIALALQVHATHQIEDSLTHRNRILQILLTQRTAQIEERDQHISDLQEKLIQTAECISTVLGANSRLVECLEETNKRAATAEQGRREWRRKAQTAFLALEDRERREGGRERVHREEREREGQGARLRGFTRRERKV